MGKLKQALFAIIVTCSLFAGEESEEAKGRALCEFAGSFFLILHDKDQDEKTLIKQLLPYTKQDDPTIRQIIKQLIKGLEQEGMDSQEAKQEAVSQLGRLIKCSVDTVDHHLPTTYLLHRKNLLEKTQIMEVLLKEDLQVNKKNFHKLMIESLADNRPDLALYAYLKIAEERCQDGTLETTPTSKQLGDGKCVASGTPPFYADKEKS